MKGMPFGVLIQAGSTSLKQMLRRSNHARVKGFYSTQRPRAGLTMQLPSGWIWRQPGLLQGPLP